MKREYIIKLGTVLLTITLLATSTGCNRLLYGTNVASIVTGWLLGGLTTANNVERQCYQNGVLIDCADLPADLDR